MKVRCIPYQLILILVFILAGNSGYGNIQRPVSETSIEHEKEYSDASKHDKHALEISLYEEASLVVHSFTDPAPSYDSACATFDTSKLQIPLLLYYKICQHIEPGLGIKQLLFPHNYHT